MFYMCWNGLAHLPILYSFNNLLNTYRPAEFSCMLEVLFFSVKIIKVAIHSSVSNNLLLQQLPMEKMMEKSYNF